MSEPARCAVTGNPVGTDTWMVGNGCWCKPCARYRVECAERERDALKAEVERLGKFLADTSLCEGCEEKRHAHLKGIASGAGSWRRRAEAAEEDTKRLDWLIEQHGDGFSRGAIDAAREEKK